MDKIARRICKFFRAASVLVISVNQHERPPPAGLAEEIQSQILEMIETDGGTHVWNGRHDGTIHDIFDLQDRITEQVAGALQPSIRIAEIERSRRKRPQDLGAYDYAMRAMPHVWALEKEESVKALDLLEKALSIEPDYPLALSLAGWCYAQRSVYNWTDNVAEAQAKAQSLAERAAELSADDPIILAVLGTIHTFVRHYGTARVLLERALATGHHDVTRVDDDDVLAGVDVLGELRTVLAAQDAGNVGRQAAERLPASVDEEPALLELCRLCLVGQRSVHAAST